MARGLAVVVAACLVTGSVPALAADKEACVSAAEAGQRLQKAHRLRAAREQLLLCSSRDCPSIVSNDCTSWLGEVERSMATVVVKARDGQGTPIYDVRILLDGSPFAAQASDAPLDVDPGPHVFRCERGGGSVEVQATLAEGERGKPIMCDMPGVVAATVPSTSTTAVPPPVTPPDAQSTGIPWSSWVLGGVAILAGGSAAVFGGLELSQQSADRTSCKPNCSSAEIGSIQTKIDVAYVSAGVAVLALGAAVIIALVAPGRSGTTASQLFPQTLPLSPW